MAPIVGAIVAGFVYRAVMEGQVYEHPPVVGSAWTKEHVRDRNRASGTRLEECARAYEDMDANISAPSRQASSSSERTGCAELAQGDALSDRRFAVAVARARLMAAAPEAASRAVPVRLREWVFTTGT